MRHRALYLAIGALALGVGALVFLLGGRSEGRVGGRGAGVAAGPSEVSAAESRPTEELPRPTPADSVGRTQAELAPIEELDSAPTLAADEFDALGVYGTVVDEHARGVAGATVMLFDGTRRLSEQTETLGETTYDDICRTCSNILRLAS